MEDPIVEPTGHGPESPDEKHLEQVAESFLKDRSISQLGSNNSSSKSLMYDSLLQDHVKNFPQRESLLRQKSPSFDSSKLSPTKKPNPLSITGRKSIGGSPARTSFASPSKVNNSTPKSPVRTPTTNSKLTPNSKKNLLVTPMGLASKLLDEKKLKNYNKEDLETYLKQLKLLKIQLGAKFAKDSEIAEIQIKKAWKYVTDKEEEAFVYETKEKSIEDVFQTHDRLVEIEKLMERVCESIAPTFEKFNNFNTMKSAQKEAETFKKSIKSFNFRTKMNQDYAERILNLEKAVKLLERINEKSDRLLNKKILDEAKRIDSVSPLITKTMSRTGSMTRGPATPRAQDQPIEPIPVPPIFSPPMKLSENPQITKSVEKIEKISSNLSDILTDDITPPKKKTVLSHNPSHIPPPNNPSPNAHIFLRSPLLKTQYSQFNFETTQPDEEEVENAPVVEEKLAKSSESVQSEVSKEILTPEKKETKEDVVITDIHVEVKGSPIGIKTQEKVINELVIDEKSDDHSVVSVKSTKSTKSVSTLVIDTEVNIVIEEPKNTQEDENIGHIEPIQNGEKQIIFNDDQKRVEEEEVQQIPIVIEEIKPTEEKIEIQDSIASPLTEASNSPSTVITEHPELMNLSPISHVSAISPISPISPVSPVSPESIIDNCDLSTVASISLHPSSPPPLASNTPLSISPEPDEAAFGINADDFPSEDMKSRETSPSKPGNNQNSPNKRFESTNIGLMPETRSPASFDPEDRQGNELKLSDRDSDSKVKSSLDSSVSGYDLLIKADHHSFSDITNSFQGSGSIDYTEGTHSTADPLKKKKRRPTIKGLVKRTRSLFSRKSSSTLGELPPPHSDPHIGKQGIAEIKTPHEWGDLQHVNDELSVSSMGQESQQGKKKSAFSSMVKRTSSIFGRRKSQTDVNNDTHKAEDHSVSEISKESETKKSSSPMKALMKRTSSIFKSKKSNELTDHSNEHHENESVGIAERSNADKPQPLVSQSSSQSIGLPPVNRNSLTRQTSNQNDSVIRDEVTPESAPSRAPTNPPTSTQPPAGDNSIQSEPKKKKGFSAFKILRRAFS